MDYYKLSEEPLQAAISNKEQGLYRMSVSMSTLAIDLLLKSVLFRIEATHDLMMGHNHAGIVTFIENVYPKNDDIRRTAKMSRKYFKDSRYSRTENLSVFTKELADKFISYTMIIKDYVDNDCRATQEDLQKKFSKHD
ncbi:MAG: HEPN domain-containing protein [Defluviitaleaceae bacterium]|nr:HEPN domain-containing protein [Defluviitaleaceae bacterium]